MSEYKGIAGGPWTDDEILALAVAWRDDGGDMKKGGVHAAKLALPHRSVSALQQRASVWGIAASRWLPRGVQSGDEWTKDEDYVLDAAWDHRRDRKWNLKITQLLLPHRTAAAIESRAKYKEFDKPYHQRSTYKPYNYGSLRDPDPPAKEIVLPKASRDIAIVAYRIWEARPMGRLAALESCATRALWPAGEPMTAHQLRGENTGIHAFKKMQTPEQYLDSYGIDANKRGNLVHGSVYLWGRVIEHQHGYRAQYAYPDVLTAQTEGMAQALRRTYGCEAFYGPWRKFGTKGNAQ